MVPNLFVLLQTCVHPHTWCRKKGKVQLHLTEEWDSPVPGIYKHKPSSGWWLIAVRDTKDQTKFREVPEHKRVVYVKVLHRWMFEEEFESRKRRGVTSRPPIDGRRSSSKSVKTFVSQSSTSTATPSPVRTKSYFRLDDGVTWIRCFDEDGDFTPGPYQPFVLAEDIDYESPDTVLRFRPMLKGDDPTRPKARLDSSASNPASLASSIHTESGASSMMAGSRRSSRMEMSQVKA